MASLILQKLVATNVEINDLGITITGPIGTTFDLLSEAAENVSLSTDTIDAITAMEIIVRDPRDNITVLSVADSILAIQNHNLTHFGISGGRFSNLDAPGFTPTPGQVVTIGPTGSAIEESISSIIAGDTNFEENIQDIVGALLTNGSDTTAVYDDVNNTLVVNVNDSFLRNTGDTLDSGTLSVASGATIQIQAGADLTVADAPVNPFDVANKEYVDMLAGISDNKDPAQVATTAPIVGTYTNVGGVGDNIATGVAALTIDGIAVVDGDRILVKNQTDPLQNGLYVASGVGVDVILTRAEDQDGSPTGEVSAANEVFILGGNVNSGASFILSGLGNKVLNTDPLNWVQSSSTTVYTNGTGTALPGTHFSLDVETLPTAAIDVTDELPFNNTTGNQTAKITVQDFLTDLNIVTSTGVGGFAVETAPNVYTNRTLEVRPLTGALAGLDIINADGVGGNPTFGLNIQGMSAGSFEPTARIPVYDPAADENSYYTVADILATNDIFRTFQFGGNSTGDGTIVADNSTDTLNFNAAAGLTTNVVAATQTVELRLTLTGLTATTSQSADSIVFFDSSNLNTPVSTTIGNFLADNNVLTTDAIGTGTGLVVKTGENPDTFTSRSVVASVAAGEQGAVITNGDGISGNITVGVDIDGLTSSATDLEATDELVVFDGINNVSMSGAQIAAGVQDILSLPAFMLSTINGQQVVTLADATRANKNLSIDSVVFTWGENALSNLDWIQPAGNATDADAGYIMPMNGTVVYVTAHCENTASNSKDIHMFIDGVDQGSIGTLTGGANVEFVDNTINIDFTQGQKIRLRAIGGGTGVIQDTVASVFVKWRG